MLAAFLTTILFSLSVICGNRTAKILGGTAANFWRLVVAAILLAIWAHGFGGGLTGRALPFFLFSGFVGFGLGDLALFEALPRLGSRLTILLVQCLAAPFAALTEWLWLGTTLSPMQLLCATIILCGVAVALTPGHGPGRSRQLSIAGIVFGLLAAFGQGFGAVLSRKAYAVANLAGEDIDGATAAYQRILGGLAVAAVFVWLMKRRLSKRHSQGAGSSGLSSDAQRRWRAAWPWVALNSLAGPTLGVSCYQWALKNAPTGIVLSIVATTPIVIIPFARVLEGDKPSARAVIGGLIAVIGAVALTMAR